MDRRPLLVRAASCRSWASSSRCASDCFSARSLCSQKAQSQRRQRREGGALQARPSAAAAYWFQWASKELRRDSLSSSRHTAQFSFPPPCPSPKALIIVAWSMKGFRRKLCSRAFCSSEAAQNQRPADARAVPAAPFCTRLKRPASYIPTWHSRRRSRTSLNKVSTAIHCRGQLQARIVKVKARDWLCKNRLLRIPIIPIRFLRLSMSSKRRDSVQAAPDTQTRRASQQT